MKTLIKTIIVDDENNARKVLENFLNSYCPQIQLVGQAQNSAEAAQLLEQREVDLMFLDIEMPHQNGIAFLQELHELGKPLPYVIFVTAYNEFAINALKLNALDYLLKPLDIEELIKAVDKVVADQVSQKSNTLTLLENFQYTDLQKRKMTLPHIHGFDVVSLEDIILLKADNNYTEVYIQNKVQPILVSKTLKYFDDLISSSGFFRAHKSYLINMNHIISYQNGKGGTLILNQDLSCELAPAKKKDFLIAFQKNNLI